MAKRHLFPESQEAATHFQTESGALRLEMRGWSGAEQDSPESVKLSEATAFLQSATRFQSKCDNRRSDPNHWSDYTKLVAD